jgi:hypothetical protein
MDNFDSGRDMRCSSHAGKAAAVPQHGGSRISIPIPDAPVSCPPASDSTGTLIHRANEHEGAGRSELDDW